MRRANAGPGQSERRRWPAAVRAGLHGPAATRQSLAAGAERGIAADARVTGTLALQDLFGISQESGQCDLGGIPFEPAVYRASSTRDAARRPTSDATRVGIGLTRHTYDERQAAGGGAIAEGFQAVLAASERERRDLFLAAANRFGTAKHDIEKDFWVCWTLGALFKGLETGGRD